jgi:uncharacterized protein
VIAPTTNTVIGPPIAVGSGPLAFGTFIVPVFPLSASDVSTTASGLVYSRVSHSFNGTVTITNISGSPISGPFSIVFTGLTAGVTLVNPTGELSESPYLTVRGVVRLAAGQVATVDVQFDNPSFGPINFSPLVYAGSI